MRYAWRFEYRLDHPRPNGKAYNRFFMPFIEEKQLSFMKRRKRTAMDFFNKGFQY
jgi:hypothetical protein